MEKVSMLRNVVMRVSTLVVTLVCLLAIILSSQSFLTASAAPEDIQFSRIPSKNQLYPRNLNTNQGAMRISGTVVKPGQFNVIVRVKRDGAAFTESDTPLNGGTAFDTTLQLPAGLFDYEVEIFTRDGNGDSLVTTVEDIAVGDVYLINGQSNAMAWENYSGDSSSANENYYIRSFGAQRNISTTVASDLSWYQAQGDEYRGQGAIGQWGIRMARQIVDNQNIPVAVINQGHGGKGIDFFQKNDALPEDLNTNYGRLLYRAKQAGVASSARAILWFQGEADGLFPSRHKNGFEDLHSDWSADYSGVGKVYIHQTRNGCGSPTPEFMEIQREFGDSLSSPDVVVLTTTGLDGHDGCHYYYTDGYETIGNQLYNVMAEELYGVPAGQNTYPPNLDTAFLTNGGASAVLRMRDADDPLVFDAGAENDFIVTCSDVTVTGGTVAGNEISLTFSGDASAAKGIAYVGHSEAGPWITNGNGVGMLTFLHEFDSTNRLPSAVVTSPTNEEIVALGAPVMLTAEVSDCDGIVTRVFFYANGEEIGTTNVSPWQFTWENAPLGTHTITVVARDDDDGFQTSAPVALTVDQPVGVSLSAPTGGAVFEAGTTVTLEANVDSSDITAVHFYYSDTLIGTATAAPWSVEWENVPTGEQSLKAIAISQANVEYPSIPVSIRVTEAPTIALIEPENEALIIEGQPATVVAQAADDRAVAQVEFFVNGESVSVDTEAPWEYTLDTTIFGAYTVEAVATDDDGISTSASAITVSVRGLPQIQLSMPVSGTVVAETGAIDISASASVNGGTITKVDFYAGETLIHTDTEAPFETTWTDLTAGKYVIRAVATDEIGNEATAPSSEVIVAKLPAVTSAPSSNAVNVGESVVLRANIADGDNTITEVAFYNGETLLFTDDAAPWEYEWSDAPAGTHMIRVVATDAEAFSVESTAVEVRVNALPTVAIQTPANNVTVTEGSDVNVTADAEDSDGTIAEVRFFNQGTLLATDTEAPWSFILEDAAEGTYELTAVAVDDSGATASSNAVTVTVEEDTTDENPDGENPDGENPDGENPDGENPDGQDGSSIFVPIMVNGDAD